MKKLTILLFALLITVGASAQTEQGKMRVGGTSDLGFSSIKQDGADNSTNSFDVSLGAGYFLINNLSLDLGLGFGYEKEGDADAFTTLGAEIGARYYLPVKVFLRAAFDVFNIKMGDNSATGTGIQFGAGYAAFINSFIAIEPQVGYRLGLSDKEKGTKSNGLFIEVGFSFYF